MTDPTQSITTLSPDRQSAALALFEYMLIDGVKAEDPDVIVTGTAERVCAAGVPLDRASSIVRLLHAQSSASARIWERGKGAHNYAFPYIAQGGHYNTSPAAVVHRTGEWLILWLPDTPDDTFDIVPELKQDGYTHYIVAPVFMKNGMANTFTFATRSPQGFSAQDLAFFRAIFPAVAATQEILATHRMMSDALRMYVGDEPARRILSGDVHRGEVVRMPAAILFADMRGFTHFTGQMRAEAATALLNAYYDCVVPHIEAAGGEVLKFIGDGILAIFRDDSEAAETCAKALSAARAALAAVAAYDGTPQFSVGIGLHFGRVAYGNVGSGARLDYTVVGRDVNLTARVAALCGELDAPLLLSAAFHDLVEAHQGDQMGQYQLKGLGAPMEIFSG